jgi:hypothetical protein
MAGSVAISIQLHSAADAVRFCFSCPVHTITSELALLVQALLCTANAVPDAKYPRHKNSVRYFGEACRADHGRRGYSTASACMPS